jgi:outer membrane protein
MKNKISLPLIISCIALTGVIILMSVNLLRTEKLAYVDNGKLIEKYTPMIELRKELEKKSSRWKSNIDTLQSDFEKALKKYEKARASMSEKERKLNEELLQNKQQQFLQYSDAAKAKSNEEANKASSSVLVKLNTFIKEYGKKNKYKLIFGANASGNIVYGDQVIDITEEIIEGANKEYTK